LNPTVSHPAPIGDDFERLNPRVEAMCDLYPPPGRTRFTTDLAAVALRGSGLTEEESSWLADQSRAAGFIISKTQTGVRIEGSSDALAMGFAAWVDREPASPSCPGRTLGRVLSTALIAASRRARIVPTAHDLEFRIGGGPPVVMGVLNLTPDSFSDGGDFADVPAAIAHAKRMIEEGATIIDVGGESTRPGADPVDAAAEQDRVLPVIEALAKTDAVRSGATFISIDTTKATVADAALEAGAHIVNDITALRDPAMAEVAAAHGAALVLMHMQGDPRTMQKKPVYDEVVDDVLAALRQAFGRAVAGGVSPSRVLVDPGIGFGKNLPQNLTLLQRLPELRSLGAPILLGASRKSFIGKITGETDPVKRLPGSLAVAALATTEGIEVLRVHDVAETIQAARTAYAVHHGGDSF